MATTHAERFSPEPKSVDLIFDRLVPIAFCVAAGLGLIAYIAGWPIVGAVGAVIVLADLVLAVGTIMGRFAVGFLNSGSN